MSKLIPQSVAARVLLALFAVVVLINLTSLFFYIVFRDRAAVTAAALQAADEIIVIRRMIDRSPPEEQRAFIASFTSPVMSLAITRGRPVVEESENQLSAQVVLKRLAQEYPKGTDIHVDSRIELGGFQAAAAAIDAATRVPLAESPPPRPRTSSRNHAFYSQTLRAFRRFFHPRADSGEAGASGVPPDLDEALFRVSIKVAKAGDLRADGSPARDDVWLNARVLLNIADPTGQYGPFAWLMAISGFIALVAFWGVSRAIVPLSLLASAAERLGVDVNIEPLSEKGPSEVRRAAHAFNTMQTRLKRFIQDRTQMLAAISHDLRTPITRLRLRAEFVDDDVQRRKMLNDLDEMEAMISATLTFARDDSTNEMATPVDAAAIIEALCSDHAAAGQAVSYAGPDSLELVAKPMALKRAINNFVENAVKYGKCARVTVTPGTRDLFIFIDDDGPGISPADAERVFAPFTRLERSRSRETGGTGLGMTIARNAIRSMGGDVELINRPEGGLRVQVSLPMAAMEYLNAAE